MRLGINRGPHGDLSIYVINDGRGVADDVHVRVSATTKRGENLFAAAVTSPPLWERRRYETGYRDAPVYTYAAFTRGPIYPHDPARLVTFGAGVGETDRVLVSARIDVRGAVPVVLDEVQVDLEGSTLMLVG